MQCEITRLDLSDNPSLREIPQLLIERADGGGLTIIGWDEIRRRGSVAANRRAGNPEAFDANQPLIGQNYKNLLARAALMANPGAVPLVDIDGFVALVRGLIDKNRTSIYGSHMEIPHMENALAKAWDYAHRECFSPESLEKLRQPFRDLGSHLDECIDAARGGITRFEAQMLVLLAGGDLGRQLEAFKLLLKVNALVEIFGPVDVWERLEARVLMQQILAEAGLPNADWAPPAIEAAFEGTGVTALNAIGQGVADPAIDAGIRVLFQRELATAARRGRMGDAYVPGAVRGLSHMYNEYIEIANPTKFREFILGDDERVEVLADNDDFKQRPISEMRDDAFSLEFATFFEGYPQLEAISLPRLKDIFTVIDSGIGENEIDVDEEERANYNTALRTLEELEIGEDRFGDLREKLGAALSLENMRNIKLKYMRQRLDEIMPPQAEQVHGQ